MTVTVPDDTAALTSYFLGRTAERNGRLDLAQGHFDRASAAAKWDTSRPVLSVKGWSVHLEDVMADFRVVVHPSDRHVFVNTQTWATINSYSEALSTFVRVFPEWTSAVDLDPTAEPWVSAIRHRAIDLRTSPTLPPDALDELTKRADRVLTTAASLNATGQLDIVHAQVFAADIADLRAQHAALVRRLHQLESTIELAEQVVLGD